MLQARQIKHMETVLLSAITKGELARIMAELIRDNNEVRMALVNLMCASPYVVTQS